MAPNAASMSPDGAVGYGGGGGRGGGGGGGGVFVFHDWLSPGLDLGGGGGFEVPEEVSAMFMLSRDFLSQGFPLQGIKCLEAVVCADPGFLPQYEAEARANLAALLLRYTHNTREAKTHLEHALRIAQDLPVSVDFSCGVISLLSTCLSCSSSSTSTSTSTSTSSSKFSSKLSPSAQQRTQVLLRGAKVAEKHRDPKWFLYFQSKRAEQLLASGDFSAALRIGRTTKAELELENAKNVNWTRYSPEMPRQSLDLTASLTQIQLELLAGDYSAGRSILDLEQQAESNLELGAYVYLYITICSIREGKLNVASLKKLESVLEKIKASQTSTQFLSPEFLEALHCLLQSIFLRLSGKFGREKASVEEALAKIEASQESHMPKLKFLLLETEVLSSLTQSKIEQARDKIEQLIGLVEAFPDKLKDLELSVHLLIGSLMMLCGSYSEAQQHFKIASSSKDKYQGNLAKLQLCFLSLQNAPDSGIGGEEIAAIQQLSFEKHSRAYPACLLCKVALAVLQKDIHQGKKLVQEALSCAHAKGDHQVIVLCLIEYAKMLSMEGDTTQARESIDAAKSLAANLHHIPSLIHALEFTEENEHLKRGKGTSEILSTLCSKWSLKVRANIADNASFHSIQRWHLV